MTSLEKIVALISQIHDDLQKVKDDYCIIGSAALVLSGLEIPVNDVDILLSKPGAIKLKEAWTGKRLRDYRPENPDQFRSEFGRFAFSMPVEVMGGLEVQNSGKWEQVTTSKMMTVNLNGLTIRIPTLKEQRRILLQLGRPKDLSKVRMIDNL